MSRAVLLLSLLLTVAAPAGADTCEQDGVVLQVLGSGGPELVDRRASSSYLVWIDGKARVLVDTGGGSALRFGEAGARTAHLDVILFTHLHVDHSADLPALVGSSQFEARARDLPVYGPPGNKFMPSTVTFVRTLFDRARGAYRYLGDVLSPLARDTYKLQPHNVIEPSTKIGAPRRAGKQPIEVYHNERVRITAIPVVHDQIPALAWRVDSGGKSIAISGDMTGDSGNLERLAANVDLLVAHGAVPEDASMAEGSRHMLPSVIGKIARAARVKQLVLSHRTRRTLGKEQEIEAVIEKYYSGPITFADDLSCFRP